jgi:hypothetical protein
VDALLRHLEQTGFKGAPRALGYDEAGRQVLSFIDGEVSDSPRDLSLDGVAAVGKLIREYHDATASFVPPPGAVWNVAIPPDSEDLICHHDLAPWNLVRSDNQFAFIDWDGAGPGSRLWDLAYAAHGFVPLSPGPQLSDREAAQRLQALVDGYELGTHGRDKLLDLLARRVHSMYELLRQGHLTHSHPWDRLWDEGHGDLWLADTRYTEGRGHVWSNALGR